MPNLQDSRSARGALELIFVAVLSCACGTSSSGSGQSATGGARNETGGAPQGGSVSGGSASLGGNSQGGAPAPQGGSTAQAGQPATGGSTAQGGSPQGGWAATGGVVSQGGTGGTASSGAGGGGVAGALGQGGSGGGGVAGAPGSGGQAGDGGASTPFAVWTNRYDNARTGANTSEKTLTVANVGGGKFGLLFSRVVDGHVYAQPLYLPGINVGGKVRNVLFVATEHNTVYAFDADDPAASAPLWSHSLGTPMRTYPGPRYQPIVAPYTVDCRDMYPETGVTSTPVIDVAAGRLYVVSKNFENETYSQRLHALDVLTGNELSGSPVTIQGAVSGKASDAAGGMVTFDAYHHMNRPGLLLANGHVFIAFGSHCDDEPYHGWVFAYAASNLERKGIYCSTPDGGAGDAGLGGIWQSGMGLVGDGDGVYFASGNGAFDADNKGAQLGQSVGRLTLDAGGLKVSDWFTPSNAETLTAQDLDYTTAPVLLPNPKVMLVGGKDGFLNVLDPANLGKVTGVSGIVQQLSVGGHSHGGPVYWNGPSGPTVYLWPEKASLRGYRFNGNKLNTTAATSFRGDTPTHPGGTTSISSNGSLAGTGLLWATFTSARVDTTSGTMGDAWHNLVPGVLYAFDANALETPIWTSALNASRDDLGTLAKFNAPIVTNGKVYVASQMAPPSDTASTAGGKIQVYGLLP